MTRSCWASDLQERTMFHDCSIFVSTGGTRVYDHDFYSNAAKVDTLPL